MTANETARRIAGPVNDVGGRFMLDGATYAHGAGLGFTGMDFYFCGRGGVLGPVDAQVVTDEFGFFEPAGVRTNWEAAESATNDGVAAALEVLDEAEQAELVELVRAAV